VRRLRETTGRIRRRVHLDGHDGGDPSTWPEDGSWPEDGLAEDDEGFDELDDPADGGDDDGADRPSRPRRPLVSRELASRLVVAVPGIAAAVALVVYGGVAFALALCVLVVLALYEFYSLTAAARPLRWAGYVGALLPVVLAFTMTSPERGVLVGLAIGAGLVAIAGLVIAGGDDITGRMAVTALGMVYVGLPFGLLMATRELPEGAAAVANVLVGTWVFDTASYAGGRLWGRRRVAPRVSPGKTWEGLACGVVVGTLAVGVAGLYMDWLSGGQSLVLGAAICAAAFVGDLFESLLKRDVGAKDSGRLLLGHGGVLDRFDALMFATVTAYFVTVALVL